MSKLSQFSITSKQKDEFYGFHRTNPGQTINRDIKVIPGNYSVYEYNLGTAFDTSTATYSKSKSIQTEDTNPREIRFGNSGAKMYTVGHTDKHIDEYDLATAFDVSTATWRTHFNVGNQDSSPQGLNFNDDGTKMYVVGTAGRPDLGIAADNVYEYALGTAWQVETAVYTDLISVASEDTSPRSMRFNADGTLMFIMGDDGDDVGEYALGTAYDVSTATFTDAFSFNAEDTSPIGFGFNTLGTKIYILGSVGSDVMEYPLVTGFDISTTQALTDTLTFAGATTPSAPLRNARGLEFNTTGSKMYVIMDAGKYIVDGGDDELPITHITRNRNTMKFYEGNTYKFDVSDSSNLGHELKFSTTSDGTWGGGTEYSTNVTTSGTAGNASAYVQIVVPKKTPSTDPGSAVDKLYYYNSKHQLTGGDIYTPEWKGNLQITYTNAVDNIDTRYATKHQEDIFEDSVFWKSGLEWTIVNGNLTVGL
tara:strand:- start:414 stop:1847 length:1434 start_codon:yes stop_codon:yes gene_type:complete